MDNRPVGFFDSGLGGASVLKEALRILPRENYIYYGDDANAPYGDRSFDDITGLTLASVDKLISYGVKAIVIACNTATATCIDTIRKHSSLPVISVEPAIKPACAMPGHGRILMLATAATTRLPRYQRLLSGMPDPARVVSVPCPGVVERIERGVTAAGAFDDLFDKYLASLKGATVDGIVLGCTHYIFIREAIAAYANTHFLGECSLFDGNEATVRQLGRILASLNMENLEGSACVEYHTSGQRAALEPIFYGLLRGR